MKIFNELATKSDTLANKLFQIAFNAQSFVEKNDSKNQSELTKKLRNLILTSNASSGTSKSKTISKNNTNTTDVFGSFIKYYFRLAKIIHVKKPKENSDQLDDRCKINNFGRLSVTFFEYLFNLFKVN